MWPVTVTLGGSPVALGSVLSDVTIRHGRSSPYDAAQASSAQLTLLGVTRAQTAQFIVGGALVISSEAGPRFTGSVTDAALEGDRLTVLAIGNLTKYGRKPLPLNWSAPSETWSARIARVVGLAGLPASAIVVQADPDFDPMLVAVPVPVPLPDEPQKLGEVLEALVDAVGALYCDRPDGKLLMQAIGARVMSGAIAIDPHHVKYAPPWVQIDDVTNDVRVKYGTGLVVGAQDTSSIALFDVRRVDLDTELVSPIDATARATERIARQAFPRWMMPSCPLTAPYPLVLGGGVKITELPAASPSETWEPIVEGWADMIVGGDWEIDLALSDPLQSGLTLSWAAVDPALKWSTMNQTVNWTQATSPGAIA